MCDCSKVDKCLRDGCKTCCYCGYVFPELSDKERENRGIAIWYEKYSRERERKLLDKRAGDLTIRELKKLLARKLLSELVEE